MTADDIDQIDIDELSLDPASMGEIPSEGVPVEYKGEKYRLVPDSDGLTLEDVDDG